MLRTFLRGWGLSCPGTRNPEDLYPELRLGGVRHFGPVADEFGFRDQVELCLLRFGAAKPGAKTKAITTRMTQFGGLVVLLVARSYELESCTPLQTQEPGQDK